jgi:hypothetical protein
MHLKSALRIICSDQEIQQLYSAFNSRGLRGYFEQYDSLRLKSLRFFLVTYLLETLLPIQRICTEGLYFEETIGELGIAHASRKILERWNLDVRYEIGGNVAKILEKQAFVSYGNHSSGLESIVFDSCFTRRNVYQIGASFAPKIGPNVSKTVLLVHNVSRSPTQLLDKSPTKTMRDRVLDRFEAFIWPPTDNPTAKEQNQKTLSAAAELVLNGCGVNIFPAGSVKVKADWKNGIGSLVRRISQQKQKYDRPVYIIPLVYGINETYPLASNLFPRLNIAHLLAKLQASIFESTPYVYAPIAIPLESLNLETLETIEITQKLKEIWLGIQQSARKRFVKWPKK